MLCLLIIPFSQNINNGFDFVGRSVLCDFRDDNAFEFNFKEDGGLFVDIYCRASPSTELEILINNALFERFAINPKEATIVPFKKGNSVKLILKLKYNYNDCCWIRMIPSVVALGFSSVSSGFTWKYDVIKIRKDKLTYDMNFYIDKAEFNAILEFKYNDKMKIDGNYSPPNPLKIIHNNNCITGITNYDIIKGQSYKIIVSTSYRESRSNLYTHFLPSFSLQFIELKSQEMEIGEKMYFDINNNTFEKIFSMDGSLFIRVDFDTANLLDIFVYSSIDYYNTTIEPPGLQTVIPFIKNRYIVIRLKYKSASKQDGIILLYSSIQEIEVDLNQKYEFKYNFKRTCGHQITSSLVYWIDDAEYNALLEFKYNDNLIIDNNINTGNPMIIWDGNENKTDITSYGIKRGQSYIIYINTKIYDLKNEAHEYIHYLPSFSFNFINAEYELGKEIYFDKNNNNLFKLTFPEDGGLFIRIDLNFSDLVIFDISSLIYNYNEIIESPGLVHVFPFKKDEEITIRLEYRASLNKKGIIWMYPSTQEIIVDFNQKYEFKHDFKGIYDHNKIFQLIYSIDKAEKNILLQFKYNTFIEPENFKTENPLKVCHEEKCKTNITTYRINKGESYKIYISTEYYKLYLDGRNSYNFNYLPAFSFYFNYLKPEFGKEISFDMDNNNIFETVFSEDGSLFIRVDFNKSNLLDIIVSSFIDYFSTNIEPPGLQTVIPFKKDKNIQIILKYKSDSNDTGIIWMYPSTQEIKVDLNKTYEFKYDFKRTCGHQITSDLIYSIDNAEYNILLQFKYNENLILDNNNTNADNPLTIWDGKENKTDITTYEICKGKSYKIYINTKIFALNSTDSEYIHYLPKFSLNFFHVVEDPGLGKEIYFDKNNNNAFKLIFQKNGALFIRVDFNISGVVNLDISSTTYNFREIIDSPGLVHVIPFKKKKQIIIRLKYESSINEKGIIWMYSSTEEIKVDLNKKYEFKYDFKGNYNNNKIYQLIYSIDKAAKDAKLEFNYNSIIGNKDFIANNPLKICHGEKCNSNIKAYRINKGESYKIYISTNLESDGSIYKQYLPAFSLQFIDVKGKEPEIGKEISFDINNNNTFDTFFYGDGSLFIRIDFNTANLLNIIISSSIDYYSTIVEPPGLQTVIPFEKEKNIVISLKYKSNSKQKGIIWMYPSTQEIKVDLNQTYEFKYDFKRKCEHQIKSSLIYSIDNAKYNSLLNFRYNHKLIIDKKINGNNPLKIWDGKEYITNITNYEFNKGKSYKIYINTKIYDLNKNPTEYIHYLPHFSFNFIYIEEKQELGKEITFDKNNNNAFKLIFPKDGGLFLRIDFNISDVVNLKIFSSIYNYSEIVTPPGLVSIIPFKKNQQIIISLIYESDSNEKGILWMYSTKKEIKVDLNQIYELYDFVGNYNNKIYLLTYRLIYSIDKASKDTRLKFKYKNYIVSKNIKINNPLKICHGGKCRTNITTYKIKKGESYKIYISSNIQDNGLEYVLCFPAFSLNFKGEDNNNKIKSLDYLSNLEISCIIILSILIIIAIVLSCFLICRKNKKPNNEIKTNKFIELASIK